MDKTISPAIPESMVVPPSESELRRIMRVFRRRRISFVSLIFIIALIFTAIFAPWVAPYDPYEQDLRNMRGEPDSQHLLGTDNLGRDTLSRIIYGSRTSLTVGVVAIGIAAAIGMGLGVVAGYFGGVTYMIIMRSIDAMMAIPGILLALTISALLGRGLNNVIIAIGISMIPPYARLMCAQTMVIKDRDYIKFMKVIGASPVRIIVMHIIPNCFPPLIVLMTMMLGGAIMAEAGLSFLGIGVLPPTATWGAMISDGYNWILTVPELSIAPGFAIMFTVFAFNMAGDGLRDALDPRLRGSL
jgi:peptide/nickel transport system permease protein